MSEKKTNVEAHVDSLIVLWHLINDPVKEWPQFTKRLENFKSFKDNYFKIVTILKSAVETVNLLQDIHDGKTVRFSGKIKKFYKDHASIIETICQYSNLRDFVTNNFDWYGKYRSNCGLDFFYDYFFNHQEDADKILAVLEKIKSLGFTTLDFDETQEFTDAEYEMNLNNNNFFIHYLDNMEAIPNYLNSIVLYKTTNSNYRITNSRSFVSDGNSILLNSLIFDSDRLPDFAYRDFLIDTISNLKSNNKEECKIVRDSVDLSIGVSDLYNQFISTSKMIDGLEKVDNKEQLQQRLFIIKLFLDDLQKESLEYEDRVSQNSPDITKESLEEEKRMYLSRRRWAKDDID